MIVLRNTLLVLVGLLLLYPVTFRLWFARWGATAAELTRRLPGDELMAEPRIRVTRAITINAPPEAVWPWLVQLGCGKAGWYSYDRLDNGGIPSATRILPEHQNLKVGDTIPMTLDGKLAPPVVALEPGHTYTMGGVLDLKGEKADASYSNLPALYWATYWTFAVEGRGDGTTRLISRSRLDWGPTWSRGMLISHGSEFASFFMERKMMLGIKQRAEAMTEEERMQWKQNAALLTP